MLTPSVHKFLNEQEKKPPIGRTGKYDQQIDTYYEKQKVYEEQFKKVKNAAKKKNTEVVADSIDNKYMPEWSENRNKQIQIL